MFWSGTTCTTVVPKSSKIQIIGPLEATIHNTTIFRSFIYALRTYHIPIMFCICMQRGKHPSPQLSDDCTGSDCRTHKPSWSHHLPKTHKTLNLPCAARWLCVDPWWVAWLLPPPPWDGLKFGIHTSRFSRLLRQLLTLQRHPGCRLVGGLKRLDYRPRTPVTP